MSKKDIPLENAGKFLKEKFSENGLRQIKEKAGKELVKLASRRIVTGVDPFGKRFVRNSPITIADKGFDKPLLRTGKMFRSYRYTILRDRIEISNAQPYADKHQFGEGVPQRIVLAAPDGKIVASILEDWLQR